MIPSGSAYETRQALREAYRGMGIFEGETPYLTRPGVESPYSAGEVDPAATEDALKYLNFMRSLAGLETVVLSRIYNYQCQHGAVLLAALDYADHDAPQPDDMDQNFYDSAHLATSSSNLAKFNWMRPTILREGIAYFVRDDGEANLPVLGHRRWLLNPYMSETGFGLANSKAGMSYVVMYAHDFGRPDADWSQVCWPTQGCFPVELMHADLAWSVSLNPEVYDLARSEIRVVLSEENLDMRFEFQCSAGTGDGFCTVNDGGYGAGPCVIFRPDFAGTDFTDYLQNQNWRVHLTGLWTLDGEPAEIEYVSEMASLYPQEAVNVELSAQETSLVPGETVSLSAEVVPSYADDLSVAWFSTDNAVATVDESGTVSAVSPGECEIVAQSVNGKSDRCRLIVSEK